MATVPLPDDPSLEQLRKQAKDVRDFSKAGFAGALELVGAHHPDGPHAVTLAGAQLVVARHYGFRSWPALKRHVETIQRYRRVPDEVRDAPSGTLADEFLLLACLRYGGDDTPSRWQRAASLLAAHPSLTAGSAHAAAAACDVAALSALLTEDPALASAEGGPYGWEPLLYLAYARHSPAVSEEACLETARLLLGHGADPDAGYLWHGLTTPFTALTGALGNGEGDQPPHPHGLALARVLLAAGADANDGQALYNRQFGSDDSHLELLLAHGLGRGDGGVWRSRLGAAAGSPASLVDGQLWWAVVHDMTDRVRLLASYGARVHAPFGPRSTRPAACRTPDGRTPAELAAICGCPGVLDWLVTHGGAARPAPDGTDGLVAAVFAGDHDAIGRLRAYAEAARADRPGLIAWAAARQAWDAIALFASLGWDVNARARTDIPMEQEWETALHTAAGDGSLAGARMLIDLGADPGIRDARFHATPLGWASHFGQEDMIAFLRPLTPDEDPG